MYRKPGSWSGFFVLRTPFYEKDILNRHINSLCTIIHRLTHKLSTSYAHDRLSYAQDYPHIQW